MRARGMDSLFFTFTSHPPDAAAPMETKVLRFSQVLHVPFRQTKRVPRPPAQQTQTTLKRSGSSENINMVTGLSNPLL